MRITKDILEQFYDWNMHKEALAHFPFKADQKPLPQAKQYAKDNPTARGFITHEKPLGGYYFYWIENGQHKAMGAIDCFMRLRGLGDV